MTANGDITYAVNVSSTSSTVSLTGHPLRDANPPLLVTGLTLDAGGNPVISFEPAACYRLTLEAADSLTNPKWQAFSGVEQRNDLFLAPDDGKTSRFYRVRLTE